MRSSIAWLFSGLVVLWTAGVVAAQTEPTAVTARSAPGSMTRTGTWSGGGGIGFLAETPDDTAFAVNLYADRFIQEGISLGPLAQLAFTDDLAQYGFSGQFKYWVPLGGMERTHLVWQAGVGLVHAAFQKDDTSWLVPLGLGLNHAVNDGVSVYATFLLNLTDLDTGRGTEADVMPGVNFGVQF